MAGDYTKLNKHIVWVVPGFASNEADDTCMPYLLELMEYIQYHCQIKLSIISLHYPYVHQPYQIGTTTIYPLNGRNKWYQKPFIWNRCLQTLNKLHHTTPIDFIHAFWYGDAALMTTAYASKHKIPCMIHLMGQDALASNRHLANKRLAHIPVIALSKYQELNFKASTGREVTEIIPFGVKEIAPSVLPAVYDIIGVGSLIPLKNYKMWIDTIGKVVKKFPNLKAAIVGSGSQEKELRSLIQQEHLTHHIELLNGQSRKRTLEHMSQSKILLHTSKYEGQGYVFIEAMRAGLHIVSSPVGYSLENEQIFKGSTSSEMAEEIIRILSKPSSKIKYDVPQVSETFNSLAKFYDSNNQ